MKICFYCPNILPVFGLAPGRTVGGAEVQIFMLGRYLARSGFAVDILVGESVPEKQSREGLTLVPAFADSAGASARGKLASAMKLISALRRSAADVYVSTCAGPEAAIIALCARAAGKKFVYRTAHEIDCSGAYEKGNGLRGRLFGFGLRSADMVVTQHEDHRRLLQSRGIAAKVIYNAFQLTDYAAIEPRDIDGLWVARCDPWKNPHLFLDVAEALSGRRFVMICSRKRAEAALFESVRSRASAIENVEFIDFVPFARSDVYYRRSKVLVGTSDFEGFPNTYIQACLAGTPIVSYKVDPSGFIERSGAGLVAKGDADRLTRLVERLIGNEAEWRRRSAEARRYARHMHDIEVEGQKWALMLRALATRELNNRSTKAQSRGASSSSVV